eukprot:SAG31_NODE_4773_length_2966_cov_1.618068_4_plen_206_part_00
MRCCAAWNPRCTWARAVAVSRIQSQLTTHLGPRVQVSSLRSKCSLSTLDAASAASATGCGARSTPPTVLECPATCSANASDAALENSPMMRSRKRLRKAVSNLSGLSSGSNCSKSDSRFPTSAEFDHMFAPSVLSDLIQLSKQMLKILMTTVGPGATSWNHATTLADKVLELAKVGRLPPRFFDLHALIESSAFVTEGGVCGLLL